MSLLSHLHLHHSELECHLNHVTIFYQHETTTIGRQYTHFQLCRATLPSILSFITSQASFKAIALKVVCLHVEATKSDTLKCLTSKKLPCTALTGAASTALECLHLAGLVPDLPCASAWAATASDTSMFHYLSN